MAGAVKEARKALRKKEVPIGAVVVHAGEVIGRGHNRKEISLDPTTHAEMAAIKGAARKLKSWRLTGPRST